MDAFRAIHEMVFAITVTILDILSQQLRKLVI